MSNLHKSSSNKMIFGVCGGLSESTGIDVSIIRLLWACAVLLAGTGLLIYIIAAIILPNG